jgi:hypothetical protein
VNNGLPAPGSLAHDGLELQEGLRHEGTTVGRAPPCPIRGSWPEVWPAR